jgi:hypothetical protein
MPKGEAKAVVTADETGARREAVGDVHSVEKSVTLRMIVKNSEGD